MATVFKKPVVCPVLVGRSGDLSALRALVDQVKRGQGQVALMSGEAGNGKSRLIAEGKTYALAQGFRLLQGNCFPGDTSCPYTPLLDLLRTHLLVRPKLRSLRSWDRLFASLLNSSQISFMNCPNRLLCRSFPRLNQNKRNVAFLRH